MLQLVLPVLILLGILIAYHDTRKGVIRNRYLLSLLILGLFYQLYSGVIPAQTTEVIITISYGFLISFLLWYIGIWPGGDAKFFTLLLFFFPAGLYSTGLILPYLMNTFIPIFLFMIAMVLVRSGGREISRAFRYSLDPYKLSFLLIILIGFVWFFNGLVKMAGIQPDYFMTIIILFVVYEAFSLAMSAKAELIFIGLVVLRIILDPWSLFTLESLYYFLLVAGIFVFFRFFLLHISYHSLTSKVAIRDLKQGMVLAEAISLEKGRYAKTSLMNSSLIEFLQQKRKRFIHGLDELTGREASRIKSLGNRGRLPFSSIRVYQTQPFAGFILLGYLITLFLQAGLLDLII
jgi:Flp pilus assembly protein protease CpaA